MLYQYCTRAPHLKSVFYQVFDNMHASLVIIVVSEITYILVWLFIKHDTNTNTLAQYGMLVFHHKLNGNNKAL